MNIYVDVLKQNIVGVNIYGLNVNIFSPRVYHTQLWNSRPYRDSRVVYSP